MSASDASRKFLWMGIVTMLCCGASAQGGEPASAGSAPAAANAPQAAAAKPATSMQQRQPALDQRIALMTAELGLDEQQQATLRRILVNQRLQIMKLWSDTSMPPASRVGATRVISNQTGDQIRAMLTDEQKAKYNQPRKPHDASNDPGARSVEDWMKAANGN